jgi:GTPase SAR1 family protein
MKNLLPLSDEEFKRTFLEIYEKYFNLLSPQFELPEITRTQPIMKKIFLFGTPNSGKTTFIRNVEVIQFYQQNKNDLYVKFYDAIVDNFEILTDECFKTDFNCVKCKSLGNCTENTQALILVVNLTNKKSLDDSKKLLDRVVDNWDLTEKDEIPLIIIGNLFEEKEREIAREDLFEYFDIERFKLEGINLNYFEIDVMRDNEGLSRVLRHIAKSII